MAKILGSTSDGGEDLQRHRVHGPPFHLGRVQFPLLQHETSIFYSDTFFYRSCGSGTQNRLLGLLIGTRSLSGSTHYWGRESLINGGILGKGRNAHKNSQQEKKKEMTNWCKREQGSLSSFPWHLHVRVIRLCPTKWPWTFSISANKRAMRARCN